MWRLNVNSSIRTTLSLVSLSCCIPFIKTQTSDTVIWERLPVRKWCSLNNFIQVAMITRIYLVWDNLDKIQFFPNWIHFSIKHIFYCKLISKSELSHSMNPTMFPRTSRASRNKPASLFGGAEGSGGRERPLQITYKTKKTTTGLFKKKTTVMDCGSFQRNSG